MSFALMANVYGACYKKAYNTVFNFIPPHGTSLFHTLAISFLAPTDTRLHFGEPRVASYGAERTRKIESTASIATLGHARRPTPVDGERAKTDARFSKPDERSTLPEIEISILLQTRAPRMTLCVHSGHKRILS